MKRISTLFALIILITGCATERYLPEQVHSDIEFGMSLEAFKQLKGDKATISDDGMSFRLVYFESVTDNEIEYYGYYFDAEGNQPLYEIIIGYKSEEQLNKAATGLFGTPNYNEKEWKIEQKKTYDLLAWKYQKKLIIAALIPESEWYEELNPK